MDPQVGGSFIPKQPVVPTGRAGGGGLFLLIGLFVFIASLAAAGAVFAYQGYLNASIASKDESLKRTEDAFEPDVIETLVRTDRRIKELRGLLERHAAPTAVFALLGDLTLQSVRYNDFDYESSAEGAQMRLSGVADSFSSVALQSDQFGASKYLSGVVFSDITINEAGRVDFTVEANVHPSLVAYGKQTFTPTNAPAPEAPAAAASSTPQSSTSSPQTP